MIKLVASSSNQFSIQPSASNADGSSYLYKFTDVFSQDEYVGLSTGSNAGPWVRLFIDVDGSYTINANKSTLPLDGGTYELNVYDATEFSPQWDTEDVNWEVENIAWDDIVAVFSIYGTEVRKWKLMGNTWSSVPGIPTQEGNSIMTTRAWVSESIDDTKYTSANENAAYVVYEG
jgi:hypothetical protein